jgi:hypothetical protein
LQVHTDAADDGDDVVVEAVEEEDDENDYVAAFAEDDDDLGYDDNDRDGDDDGASMQMTRNTGFLICVGYRGCFLIGFDVLLADTDNDQRLDCGRTNIFISTTSLFYDLCPFAFLLTRGPLLS